MGRVIPHLDKEGPRIFQTTGKKKSVLDLAFSGSYKVTTGLFLTLHSTQQVAKAFGIKILFIFFMETSEFWKGRKNKLSPYKYLKETLS